LTYPSNPIQAGPSAPRPATVYPGPATVHPRPATVHPGPAVFPAAAPGFELRHTTLQTVPPDSSGTQFRQTASADCSTRPFGSQLRQTTSIDCSDTQPGLIVPPVRRSGQRAGCLPTRGQPCSSRHSSRRPATGFYCGQASLEPELSTLVPQ
jgi:hypothetical protein